MELGGRLPSPYIPRCKGPSPGRLSHALVSECVTLSERCDPGSDDVAVASATAHGPSSENVNKFYCLIECLILAIVCFAHLLLYLSISPSSDCFVEPPTILWKFSQYRGLERGSEIWIADVFPKRVCYASKTEATMGASFHSETKVDPGDPPRSEIRDPQPQP